VSGLKDVPAKTGGVGKIQDEKYASWKRGANLGYWGVELKLKGKCNTWGGMTTTVGKGNLNGCITNKEREHEGDQGGRTWWN